MCGGSILSCCPRNPHGHERALKEEEEGEEKIKCTLAWDQRPRGMALIAYHWQFDTNIDFWLVVQRLNDKQHLTGEIW